LGGIFGEADTPRRYGCGYRSGATSNGNSNRSNDDNRSGSSNAGNNQ
jgi:hypothetical protein